MESFNKSNKAVFLFYEMLGTAILTFGANVAMTAVPAFLLLTSIWSWQLSSAHFNSAVTLAAFCFDLEHLAANIIPLISILAA